MSLFGTFRKKGKKVPLTFGSIKNTSSPKGTLFSSTPNLCKISNDGSVTIPKSANNSWKASHHHHGEDEDSDYGDDCDNSEISHGYEECGSAAMGTATTSFQNSGTIAKKPVPERKNSLQALLVGSNSGPATSGMKRFMSMVSMASSLKRGKKPNKQQSFASSTSNLHRIESERREQVIFEDNQISSGGTGAAKVKGQLAGSPAATASATEVTMKSIKSAPTLQKKSRSHHEDIEDEEHDEEEEIITTAVVSNTEPGVISSSSSTSSCNQSETGSLSSYNTSSISRSISKLSTLNKLKKKQSASESEFIIETSVNTKYVQDINKTQLMLQGAKKFNMDQKRGIDYLVLNGIIERTPEGVAQFLKDGEGLSKTAIGNYLGEYKEFNLAVLLEFVNLHDFTDVLLVQALRQFLWSFRLPGESQKIDRMMESFAKRYCQLNPHLFECSDTCYLLSFAIIMLNTSLHNPNVKDKTTLEQFIRMTDDGHKLDRQFLTSLYNSIQEEPFKIPEEDGNDFMLTFFNPDIEGWLWKQGSHYKSWKRRWFILSNNCLYYFRFTTDRVPRGIIPLENIIAKSTHHGHSKSSGKKHQYTFTLYKKTIIDNNQLQVMDYIKSCKTLSDGQTVPVQHSTYNLATNSEAERTRWIEAISQNSSSHDFYTFLAQRKSKLQALQHQPRSNKRGTLSPSDAKKSKSSSSTSTKKSTSVRKSQISLPLTTAMGHPQSASALDLIGDTSTVEYSYFMNPEKNPHNYFLTLPTKKSSSSNPKISLSSQNSFSSSGRNSSNDSSEIVCCASDSEADGEGEISISTFSGTQEFVVPPSHVDSDSNQQLSAADFLIRKYALPIQESTSSILKRCEPEQSIIPTIPIPQPPPLPDITICLVEPSTDEDAEKEIPISILWKNNNKAIPIEQETDSIDLNISHPEPKLQELSSSLLSPESGPKMTIVEFTSESHPDVKFEIELPLADLNATKSSPPICANEINSAKIETHSNFNENPSEDWTIIEADEALPPPSSSSEKILKNKKRSYKKESSLEKHIEEILEKQKTCISTTDLETIRISSSQEELEKIEKSDRTIEKVSSFTSSLITTTVTKSVHPQETETELSASGLMDLDSSVHNHEIRLDYSNCDVDDNNENSKISNTSISKQTVEERILDISMPVEESLNVVDNEETLVETFNSVMIGNVRHTEV